MQEWRSSADEPYPDFEDCAWRATTDADGRFRLLETPVTPSRLIVEAPGFATTIDGPFEPLPGALVEREVVLDPGLSLRCRVADASGQPASGARLRLQAQELPTGRHFSEQRAAAGPDGIHEFTHLQPAVYEVSWIDPAGEDTFICLQRRVVQVEQGGASVDLQPRGATRVVGTLAGGRTSGLHGSVWMWPADMVVHDLEDEVARAERMFSTRTTDGTFELAGVLPGAYTLSASVASHSEEGYWEASEPVTVGDEPVLEVTVPLVLDD